MLICKPEQLFYVNIIQGTVPSDAFHNSFVCFGSEFFGW